MCRGTRSQGRQEHTVSVPLGAPPTCVPTGRAGRQGLTTLFSKTWVLKLRKQSSPALGSEGKEGAQRPSEPPVRWETGVSLSG